MAHGPACMPGADAQLVRRATGWLIVPLIEELCCTGVEYPRVLQLVENMRCVDHLLSCIGGSFVDCKHPGAYLTASW